MADTDRELLRRSDVSSSQSILSDLIAGDGEKEWWEDRYNLKRLDTARSLTKNLCRTRAPRAHIVWQLENLAWYTL